MLVAMKVSGVYEAVVYGEDLDALEGFYGELLRLRRTGVGSARGRAFRVSAGQMLLVFRASQTRRAHADVPSHGMEGQGHVALAVEGLEAWRARLASAGVAVEREVPWPAGGRSIYVRDPAGNSVELIEGEAWEA